MLKFWNRQREKGKLKSLRHLSEKQHRKIHRGNLRKNNNKFTNARTPPPLVFDVINECWDRL